MSDFNCRPNCSACWRERHEGHDISSRHEAGRLFSATCYDCDAWYVSINIEARADLATFDDMAHAASGGDDR